MVYRVAQDRERFAVLNLIIFPHLSLEMRFREMAFVERLVNLEVKIGKDIEMVEVIFRLVVIPVKIIQIIVVFLEEIKNILEMVGEV